MENILKEILRVVEPSTTDRQTRSHILQELQGAVRSVQCLRGATVEPFGSFVSELFTRWGDLDVSIEFSKGSYISSYGRKHTLDVLRELMRTMRQRGGWNTYEFIPNARVPILMVKSNLENISCDISVNNLKAQMKSKLFLWITEIDPRFRDMVLLVKEWAKAQNINDSKSGTFSSYSLSLLVVFHFQTCVPAILPPLKDIYPVNLMDDLKGWRADAEKHIENTCADNIRRFKLNIFRAQNNSSLSELFISFLGKFSDIVRKAVGLGICTYSGKWESIGSNMGWLPKTYCILVEDPFERPENTARGVGRGELRRISKAFEMSRDRLISARYNSSLAIESSLLATLVQPHTLHLLRNSGATVEPFGSFVSNLYTCWGDLDVSIEFSKGSYISSYGKKHKEQLLGVVMRAMRQRGKGMGKSTKYDNPKLGSFNSYALTLLVVFHFQVESYHFSSILLCVSSEAFKMSSHILMSANQSDILATLVRPLTYRLVIGTSQYQLEHHHAAYPQRFMTENPHSRTPRPCRPQVHKWAQKPSQVHPQFQKMKPENHPTSPPFKR